MAVIKDELQKFSEELQNYVAKNFKSTTHHAVLTGLTFHTKEKDEVEENAPLVGPIAHPLTCQINSQGQVVCS